MATAGRRCGGRGVESGLTTSFTLAPLCDRPGCKAAVGRLHCTLAPCQVGGPPLPSSPSSHKGLPYRGSHYQHSQCPPIRDELASTMHTRPLPGRGPPLPSSPSSHKGLPYRGSHYQHSQCPPIRDELALTMHTHLLAR